MIDGKLGVAIHGAGWVAGAHAASWIKNPLVRVVSISDIARDRAQALADRYRLACSIRDNRLGSKKLFPGQTGWTTIPTILPDSADVYHHPFDGEINHFVECIRQNRESHCSVADGYRTHELCLAIDRSIEEGGRPVRLPLA